MEKLSPHAQNSLSARNKMMDYLSHREHSETELREKLQSHFSLEEIESAIAYGKDHGWIPNSEASAQALSEKTAETLRRKGKGQVYINNYLEERGLPPVRYDDTEELDKALALVKNKFSDLKDMDLSQKAKVGRFLTSRGFDSEVIRKVLND